MKTLWCAVILVSLPALFFGAMSGQAHGQIDRRPLVIAGKNQIERGVASWNLDTLMEARGTFERLLTLKEDDYLAHYYQAYADYRICIMYLAREDKDAAGAYLEEGIRHGERSVELQPVFCESNALLASLCGMKIAFKWYLAITLGAKSGEYFDIALALDTVNPRTRLLLGVSNYHTPKLFGGGMENAMAHLRRAIALYETEAPRDSLLPDWGHEEAHAWLGKVYLEQNDYTNARLQFTRAMEIKPEYGWVKFNLLPELDRRAGKEGVE